MVMQKDNFKGVVAERMRRKLEAALQPLELSVTDISHRHAGHAGARPEGETHFEVAIVSEKFRGQSRVQRHQRVYEVLKEEMGNPVHALAIRAEVPGK